MVKFLITCCVVLSASLVFAQETTRSKVMLIGVFHFANPGLDVVKTNQIDVMSAENQHYLQGLATRLAEFKPTHILLECLPGEAHLYSSEYGKYLQNEIVLQLRESHQLGFRIAKQAGLAEIHCYDDRSVEWEAEAMLEYVTESDPELLLAFNESIAEITAKLDEFHRTLSLEELLIQHNSADLDRMNKGLYLLTNSAGAGDGFSGANATASWWHRNLKMYANIQNIASPNTRVIVIGGQGHTAILKDFLDIDEDRESVNVNPYLNAE